MLSLLAARSSPAVNVAEIDRERILKAAEMALAQPPVTITSSRAKWSQGGPNDFYSNVKVKVKGSVLEK